MHVRQYHTLEKWILARCLAGGEIVRLEVPIRALKEAKVMQGCVRG